jgi:DNA (cytosine-5)-methyltransferase 1
MSIRDDGQGAGQDNAGPTVLEFFAGGGLAGIGLRQAGFRTLFANDIDGAKAQSFRTNHPDIAFSPSDVWTLEASDLPRAATLCWASSPCQDVSLAGTRGGLQSQRSGAFWGFWRLIEAWMASGRHPPMIVIENVTGLLSSSGGSDFAAILSALGRAGYQVGALEIDARLWLPQSRPRLFIIATRGLTIASTPTPTAPFHSPRLIAAQAKLAPDIRAAWIWYSLKPPPRLNIDLSALLIPDEEADWLDGAATDNLIALAAPLHRARIETALASGQRQVGAGFRRVRLEGGIKKQRLEVRFDGLAGCLRTPSGGSSRQYILVIEPGRLRARRLTSREAARLMGVEDSYILPASEMAGLKLMGDAVAVPVVKALGEQLLMPALRGGRHLSSTGRNPD